MSRLLLHVGFHKTGTSAVQAFAYRYRRALFKRGVWYPDYRPVSRLRQDAHHAFAHSLAGVEAPLAPEQSKKLVAYWREQLLESKHVLLLSAEAMSRHLIGDPGDDWLSRRRRYVASLHEQLDGFEVDVIVVLRRQDDYVRSMFQDYLRSGPRGISSWMEGGRRGLLALSFPRFRAALAQSTLRYLDNLLLFEEFFGRPKVLLYDDLKAGGELAKAFFNELGVDTDGLADVGVVHASPSYEETTLKKLVWPLAASGRTNEWLNNFLQWVAARILHPYFGQDRLEDLWEGGRAWFDFLETYSQENARIAARYFPLRPGPLFD